MTLKLTLKLTQQNTQNFGVETLTKEMSGNIVFVRETRKKDVIDK